MRWQHPDSDGPSPSQGAGRRWVLADKKFPLAWGKWAAPTPRLQSEAASVYLISRT